jgi:hypothetical protein
MAPPPVPMPARGERAAPTFDRNKPRELPRFFDELEFLFERAAITDETTKKKQLLRYVDYEIEQIWKTFDEFRNPADTYEDFKQAVLNYYPDATGDFVYSLRDVDSLIGERQRIGITSTSDLTEYHLQFHAITSWLIEKKQLGDLEQQRTYIRAFQPPFLAAIMNRLQLKDPDHHPNTPYKIKNVYEAARFILQGAIPTQQSPFSPLAPTATPIKQEPVIKTENIGIILSEFTKTIVEAINNNRPRSDNTSTAPRNMDCNFCGKRHFIRDCEVVTEYIRAGKCKKNTEGKVVLPSGAWVPREIPGNFLRERIDEWHHRNPNQLATATLINVISNPDSQANTTESQTPVFQLSTTDRIATLEAELFQLRQKKTFTPAVRTRAQRAREERTEEEEEIPVANKNNQSRIEEVEDEEATAPAIRAQTPVINPTATKAPEHPYRYAKDAAYTPPTNRNIGHPITVPAQLQPTATATKKQEPAYRTLPPVYDPQIAMDVYKRTMDTAITITQRELLCLSPEVRTQIREATTIRRTPPKDTATTDNKYQVIDPDNTDQFQYTATFGYNSQDNKRLATTNTATSKIPPPGSLVIGDEYENYYKSLGPGEEPDQDRLTVSAESLAIRSVMALIDSKEQHECILDPGSQIVAMAETSCHELQISYDPTIKLNLQSANGTLNQTLGLARNVPFQIGEITVYLQVHIIRNPAYDVLLGRPFDVLTESVVRNYSNEAQTITINDPNSMRRITVPTFSRSLANRKCPHQHQQGFR